MTYMSTSTLRHFLVRVLQRIITYCYRFIGILEPAIDYSSDGLYRTELKLFLQTFFPGIRGKRVLDLGTGQWGWTKQSIGELCDVTTFDVRDGEHVDVVGNVYELLHFFEENTFDYVFATDVFEHLLDIPRALNGVRSVLKRGGTLIISTPFNKELHGEEYGDYWRVTRQGWDVLLRQNGFERKRMQWVGQEIFPKAYLLDAQKV